MHIHVPSVLSSKAGIFLIPNVFHSELRHSKWGQFRPNSQFLVYILYGEIPLLYFSEHFISDVFHF